MILEEISFHLQEFVLYYTIVWYDLEKIFYQRVKVFGGINTSKK